MIQTLSKLRDIFSFSEGKALKLSGEVQELLRAIVPKFEMSRFFTKERDYEKYVKQYNGWVYACASKNAATVASVPLRLYAAPTKTGVRDKVSWRSIDKRNKNYLTTKSHLGPLLNNAANVVEITDHPFLNMMREVNPMYNGFELIELMELSLELTGNAYWYVQLSNGVPTELWPLQSQWVNIVRNPIRGIDYYEYGKDQADSVSIDPDFVAHFRFPNPTDYFYGMGPLEAAQLPAILNVKFDEFENSMLDNNAVMPFILSTPQNLNDGAIERLRHDVNVLHRGVKKAGKFGVFTGGLEPKPLGAMPSDINYSEGLRMTKEKIAAIFGVPLSLLTTEDVNLANSREGHPQYMRNSINPRLKRIEQTINQDVMPFYDERLFVSFDNPIPDDKEFILNEANVRLANYSMTINEYREKLGEKTVAWGDEPLASGVVNPLSEAGTPEAPEPTPGPLEPTPEEIAGGGPPLPETEEEAPEEEEGKYLKGVRRVIEKDVKRWLRTQSATILIGAKAIEFTDPGVVDAFVNWSEIERDGRDQIGEGITDYLNEGAFKGAARVRDLGLPAGWKVTNTHAVEFAEKHVGKRVEMITGETRGAIRDIVAAGIQRGHTEQTVSSRIRKKLEEGVGLNKRQRMHAENYEDKLLDQGNSRKVVDRQLAKLREEQLKYRASMIARTETAHAWAEGNMASYREAGVAKKEYSSSGEACSICAPHQGKVYKMNDHSISIPLHPHCRCDWLPVIE